MEQEQTRAELRSRSDIPPLTDTQARGSSPDRHSSRVARGLSSTLQIRRFVAVGILNTLVDYVLFVALTKIFRIPLDWVWVAKLLSGTVAISISFYLNRGWVFQAKQGKAKAQAAKFVAATAVGVYAIQTPLTQLFAGVYDEPGKGLYDLLRSIGLTGGSPSVVTEALSIKTAAFALATVVSMVFNFLAYRHWVFRGSGASSPPVRRGARQRPS